MKVRIDFDLKNANWGDLVDAPMGVRIETPHGIVTVSQDSDGTLFVSARDGFLIVVPVGANSIRMRPKLTAHLDPFGDALPPLQEKSND